MEKSERVVLSDVTYRYEEEGKTALVIAVGCTGGRHRSVAVARALAAIRRAEAAMENGLTPDAILTDAEDALNAIGELTGRTAREDIVSTIFSRFCVGK